MWNKRLIILVLALVVLVVLGGGYYLLKTGVIDLSRGKASSGFPDFAFEYRFRVQAPATPTGQAARYAVVLNGMTQQIDPTDPKGKRKLPHVFVSGKPDGSLGDWTAWNTVNASKTDPNTKGIFNTQINLVLSSNKILVMWFGFVGSPGKIVPQPSASNLVKVEVETRVAGQVTNNQAILNGRKLGFIVENRTPPITVKTMAAYNQRYDQSLNAADAELAAQNWPFVRPQLFTVVDSLHTGDDDTVNFEQNIQRMARFGSNTLRMSNWNSKQPQEGQYQKTILTQNGYNKVSGGTWYVGNPKGGYFGFAGWSGNTDWPNPNPNLIQWAQSMANNFTSAGWNLSDVKLFAFADEPGFGFPLWIDNFIRSGGNHPSDLVRFQNYLQSQGLTPADVGASSWSQVVPSKRGTAVAAHGSAPLAARKLFYWSARFFDRAFTEQSQKVTQALESAFYPGIKTFSNWNNIIGATTYIPDKGGNSPGPDQAQGKPNWFDYGRNKGSNLLWTEDWFGDNSANAWSVIASKLKSAGRKYNLDFGGYIVGLAAGKNPGGLIQKTLALVGHGSKTFEVYTYGPTYNFPENGWSEKLQIYPDVKKAIGLVGKAENSLYPGISDRAQVAILAPTSSFYWTAIDKAIPTKQEKSNQWNNEATTLYYGLTHKGVPVDYIDEDGVGAGELTTYGYKVLYLTEPNVPANLYPKIEQWVKGGGVLVTTVSAGSRDEYDSPISLLDDLTGIQRTGNPAILAAESTSVRKKVQAQPPLTGLAIFSPGFFNEQFTVIPNANVQILAKFATGEPALTKRAVGQGFILHFATLPGNSYGRNRDSQPNAKARDWIAYPAIQIAQVKIPVAVNVPRVETPVLRSVSGSTTTYAITFLNWRNEDTTNISAKFNMPGLGNKTVKVESARKGVLSRTVDNSGVSFNFQLGPADVITISVSP